MGIPGKIKLGILSSSRADFGIYLPLLRRLRQEEGFTYDIIAFGTHLSKAHGYTLRDIESEGFEATYTIEAMISNDSPNAISTSYALTALKFSDFWKENADNFDCVFALGDRFEMAAAVAASIPFQVKIAHLHGGETTLGATDNVFRHSISLASWLHFVSTDVFKARLIEILESDSMIFNVGSLSLENLDQIELLSKEAFFQKWGIDLNLKSILVTVHPETIDVDSNQYFANELKTTLLQLSEWFQIVVTLPNADTSGQIFRETYKELKNSLGSKIILIENFGTQSYFTIMKYAQLLLGNTSSGIVEAASFNKYVINLGNRQKGRLSGENVVHIPFSSREIIKEVLRLKDSIFTGNNFYYQKEPSKKIIEVLKKYCHVSFF